MAVDLHALNDNQRQAVLWDDGPLLVLASPGSGKTHVLATRVTRLLDEQTDASILALTFTNKAAAEMRARVDLLLGRRADRAHLSTFHAYATQILRQHGSHVGVRPDFTLLMLEEDRLALLEDVIRQVSVEGHDVPTDRHSVLRLVDHLFREAYDGGPDLPGLHTRPPWVAILFVRYCSALLAANRQDFGSLLHMACRLLREKPGVARVLRVSWSHVCVDEFQDTNKAQYELLKLLAPPRKPNLFVVGDDDQIIFQWNGASPERLEALRSEYDVELLQLPQSYRCPPEIIELANRLIRHNKSRTAGKMPVTARRPPSSVDDVVQYREFDTPAEEAAFVAKDIFARGPEAAECVVLARTTKLLEQAAHALADLGIAFYLAKRKNDFETAPVRVMQLALRLANARHDREVLRRLCVAWEALTSTTVEVESVIASSTLIGGDFLRTWSEVAGETAGDVAAVLLDKLRASLVERLEFPDIVNWFLSSGGASFEPTFGDDLRDELNIWRDFHNDHVREHGASSVTLHAYLQSLDLTSKVAPPPPKAVHCLTVHGAKGLEFKHVYLIGMAQQILPSFQALNKGSTSRELEEERRNCFVAITRSRETLTLTRAKEYNGWAKGPSQFLFEMAGNEG